MKIIFLLDTNEFLEATPDKLQLRQISAGRAAIGVELTVPVRNEDGTSKVVDGQTQTQQGFLPLVDFPVTLALSAPAVPAKKSLKKTAKKRK